MVNITATAVKELRQRTGAGMMDCKQALVEAAGDEERAIDLLRQRGVTKAAERVGREAREGAVQIAARVDGAAMAELSSETDFVSRSESFVGFARRVAESVLASDLRSGQVMDGEEFLARAEVNSLSDELNELRSRVGENVGLVRCVRLEAPEGSVGSYLHFGNRIGVLVELSTTGANDLAKEVAMHVAATAPVAIRPEDIPEEMRERERSVLEEQAKGEGKPPQIVDKIVEGRMRKFYEDSVLLWQKFVKDPEKRVSDLLAECGEDPKVRRFVRFQVGD